jgi:acyl-CoA dehydrogenase
MGVCQDTPLPRLWANCRTLRLADGPDEVHLEAIGKEELARARL